MESEKTMAVLTELLEEQKEIARVQAKTMMAIQELKIQTEGIESAVKNQKPIVTPVDIKPIQQTVERSIADIKFLVEMLGRKSQSNNMRVFLESDAKKWAVILIIALVFLTYLFCFAIHKQRA
jgi:hypothetical protein